MIPTRLDIRKADSRRLAALFDFAAGSDGLEEADYEMEPSPAEGCAKPAEPDNEKLASSRPEEAEP